jgi:hypothetical protein
MNEPDAINVAPKDETKKDEGSGAGVSGAKPS